MNKEIFIYALINKLTSSSDNTFLVLFLIFLYVYKNDLLYYVSRASSVFKNNNLSYIKFQGFIKEPRQDKLVYKFSKEFKALSYVIASSTNLKLLHVFEDEITRELYRLSNLDSYVIEETEPLFIKHKNHTIKIEHSSGVKHVKDEMIQTLTLSLSSDKHENIIDYVKHALEEYDKYKKESNKGKLFHFIYKGCTGDKDRDTSDESKFLVNDITVNYETFDTVFSKHNKNIKKDIDRLCDLEYYKRTGSRRKKGYIFYGPPGVGKTSMVMAIKNYSKRHIIEVPMSRIKNGSEIDFLLNINSINSIDFNKNEIIILLDEIDIGLKGICENEDKRNENEDKGEDKDDEKTPTSLSPSSFNISKHKSKDSSKQSLSPSDLITSFLNKKENYMDVLLSRLDGIGNYDGLIVIATTNNVGDLHPSLIRPGRLTPIFFDYIDKNECKDMLEAILDVKIDDNTIDKLPDVSDKIQHSCVRKLIEESEGVCEVVCDIKPGNINGNQQSRLEYIVKQLKDKNE
jgi:hypothetical protein